MLKLIKYLRPHIGSVILIFALLFVQAMADLELPSYMSRIVNIGIQQKGISETVPGVIRQQQLDRLLLLLDESDSSALRQAYQLLDREALTPAEFSELSRLYPLLASENIAQLDSEAEMSAELVASVGRAMALKAAINSGLPLDDLPDGMDFFDMLASLPAAQRQMILTEIDSKMSALSDNMLEQYAAAAIQTEYAAIGVDLTSTQNSFILSTGGMMLLIALLGAVCSILVGLVGARVSASIALALRRDIFTRVENFSSAEFDQFSTASLITRTTNDIQQIQMTLVMLLRILLYAPILGIGGVLKVLQTDSSMTWIIAVGVATLLTMIITLFMIALPRFKMIQKLVDRLNLVTREILTGLMVIRAFNTQAHQEQKFDEANRDITRISLFIGRLMAALMPMMMLLMNGISILIVWIGAQQVDAGSMQVGDVMAFIQYTMQIIMAFLMLSMVFIMLPRASVSGQRVAEVLAVKPTIVDKDAGIHFPADGKGLVEFRQVAFQYSKADEPVLTDISFRAEPGKTTAFIGSTGCGKSTLVNLIPRFYDVTGGQVLIDGIDIREVKQKDLRDRIGYVAQKGILFTGDIRSNIAYGKSDADDDEIRAASAVAQAIDFIEASEQQFATPIAQGGANVSGGQKQRLAIARALVRRPDIYIFDDTFSALDYKTDAALRRALFQSTGGSTVLIVAQRIGTILHADQIIVLDQGRIVGIGTHSELLTECQVYREIAASQLSEEELAL